MSSCVNEWETLYNMQGVSVSPDCTKYKGRFVLSVVESLKTILSRDNVPCTK